MIAQYAMAGTNGLVTIPLTDAETGSTPQVKSGPGFARNSLRFFARMPSLEQATQLPAPGDRDRASIRFEVKCLVYTSFLGPNTTGHFYRIDTPHGRGRLSERKLHLWTPNEESGAWPAHVAHAPLLNPGDFVEIHGVSWFYNPGVKQGRGSVLHNANVPRTDPPPYPVPYPMEFFLVCRAQWLPKAGTREVRLVDGDPMTWIGRMNGR
jgi:hypothetical protein